MTAFFSFYAQFTRYFVFTKLYMWYSFSLYSTTDGICSLYTPYVCVSFITLSKNHYQSTTVFAIDFCGKGFQFKINSSFKSRLGTTVGMSIRFCHLVISFYYKYLLNFQPATLLLWVKTAEKGHSEYGQLRLFLVYSLFFCCFQAST